MRNDLRDSVVTELSSRILEACVRQAELPGGMPLDVVINETLYFETKRLDSEKNRRRRKADKKFWSGIKHKLGKASDQQQRQLLQQVVGRLAEEVCGNFNPRVYAAATKVLPKALPFVLNAVSPKKIALREGIPEVGDTIRIQGSIDALRRCQKLGTVVFTPTHVSNLDSPVVGWALFAMGLPPFTYGAGLNLFANPMLSFFMNNLGAYRVDRLKKAPLYKDILKEYATVSIEFGQSNLFFPAGTRVRSGEVEQRLKLGLLSSGLRAYINNLARNKARPNIYVVPCNLNYHLVLEAETLIEDHLKREGKARYIIDDDEFSRPRRVAHFISELVNLDAAITVTVGDPLDVFGNRVDAEGGSIDDHGRRIDITRYVKDRAGQPVHMPQRDRVYTHEAGEAIARAFRRNNVVLTTNLVAFAMFQHLCGRHPGMDLYRLLRSAGDGTGIEMGLLADRVRRVTDGVRQLAARGEIRMEDTVAGGEPIAIISDALRHFGSYHTHPVLHRRGDRVFAGEMNLLLYYHNRLKGYGLESLARAERAGGSDEEAA